MNVECERPIGSHTRRCPADKWDLIASTAPARKGEVIIVYASTSDLMLIGIKSTAMNYEHKRGHGNGVSFAVPYRASLSEHNLLIMKFNGKLSRA